MPPGDAQCRPELTGVQGDECLVPAGEVIGRGESGVDHGVPSRPGGPSISWLPGQGEELPAVLQHLQPRFPQQVR